MTDYEKLGVFYLGKAFDMNSGKLGEQLVLYDSKDLTTHAVIIGMTGSGKTGLALGLLEEALIDNIPVIAIDPKGDLPNLLLTFPNLSAEDFLPWADEQEAVAAGRLEPGTGAHRPPAGGRRTGRLHAGQPVGPAGERPGQLRAAARSRHGGPRPCAGARPEHHHLAAGSRGDRRRPHQQP
jgi:hypothetical protein